MTFQSGYQPNADVSPYMVGNPTFHSIDEPTKREYRFYTQLIEKGIIEIKPINMDCGIGYPALDLLKDIYPLDTVLNYLESLSSKHWIRRVGSETILECPDCDSTHLHAKGYCAKCGSSKVNNETIIEHKLCGFTGYEHLFSRSIDNVCPKCDRLIKENDTRVIGALFACDVCKARFGEPRIGYTCIQCSKDFSLNNAQYRIAYSYSLSIKERETRVRKRPIIRKTSDKEPDLPMNKPRSRLVSKKTLTLPFERDEPDDYEEDHVLYPLNDD